MAIERTFSIIKPDAVRRNLIGAILTKFEEAGLRPVALKKIKMTRAQAEGFYAVQQGASASSASWSSRCFRARSSSRCWKARARS